LHGPPQGRHGIGKIALAASAILMVVVALVAFQAAVAVQPPPPSSSSISRTTTRLTSTVQDPSSTSSQGPLKIQVFRATLDNVSFDAPSGFCTYIYDVTVTDEGTSAYLTSPLYFQLVSGSNSFRNFTISRGVVDYLPTVTLQPGQQASGEIPFRVADGQKPTKLLYLDPAHSVSVLVTELPQPSRWISNIYAATAVVSGNVSVSDSVYAVIQNQSDALYYSGDVISVEVSISAAGGNATAFTIGSVTVSDPGFMVSRTFPGLPFPVRGGGAETNMLVDVVVPDASLSAQTIELVLTAD
jgi:hypothetical protein